MALRWNWKEKMGKVTISQNGQDFKVNIYNGNALGIFIYEWTNNDGEDRYTLFSFFMDKQHVKRMLKSSGSLFGDKAKAISLNLYYDNARTLLDIFVKQGYKVTCYYKEPK